MENYLATEPCNQELFWLRVDLTFAPSCGASRTPGHLAGMCTNPTPEVLLISRYVTRVSMSTQTPFARRHLVIAYRKVSMLTVLAHKVGRTEPPTHLCKKGGGMRESHRRWRASCSIVTLPFTTLQQQRLFHSPQTPLLRYCARDQF